MASSSSSLAVFHAEDQTDEDFFDKLVDDDELGTGGSGVGGMSRILSNGSLGESENDGGVKTLKVEDLGVAASKENLGPMVDVGSSDLVPKTLTFEKVVLLDDPQVEDLKVVAPKVASTGLSLEKSADESVKDWSAFASFGGQHDLGNFGSFSDFFPEGSSGFSEELTVNQNSIGGMEESTASDLSTFFGNVEQRGDQAQYDVDGPSSLLQQQGGQVWDEASEQSSLTKQQDNQASLDANDPQYWESLYPGWKYDSNTGQWYQIGSYDTYPNAQGNGYGAAVVTTAAMTQLVADSAQINSYGSDLSTQLDAIGNEFDNTKENSHGITHLANDDSKPVVAQEIASDQSSNVSYMQQTVQSVAENIAEDSPATDSAWNYASQETTQYPNNMIFDPQYPGWYYDTNIQQWQTLETYSQSVDMPTSNQAGSVDSGTPGGFSLEQNHNMHDNDVGQFNNQTLASQSSHINGGWGESFSSYSQQNLWKPQTNNVQGSLSGLSENRQKLNFYDQTYYDGNHTEKEVHFETTETFPNKIYGNSSSTSNTQCSIPSKSLYQTNDPNVEQCQQTSTSHSYSGNQTLVSYSQQAFQSENLNYSQFSYTSMDGRSSSGRPAHTLVTFGFGGKLLVMKNNSFGANSSFGIQDASGGTISVLNLLDVIMEKSGSSGIGLYNLDYFHSLCNQSFPGPLVGGSTTSKELNKWIDERIASCETATMDLRKGEHLRLLLSLLKISHQYYGRLRSPFGTDSSLLENDGPESAVTKLFASARKNGAHGREYGTLNHCMHNLPTDGESQAIALEVQTLLVSGKRKEALQRAQEGMLWGPALVLATQLGEKFYIDTVKQMANRQFVSGSPLRTLCLLIVGCAADVFTDGALTNDLPKKVSVPQQSSQVLANDLLDAWEENLAIISANRTKDDGLVIVHLGDCLCKERGEITAAHTCYLLAEANIESYSDSARLCLIGADHWNNPRTYASPEAIQRTEFYEYSRVHWNPQFQLLSFQPYKLIYAYMLAEVGKVSESSRYCQAILKVLKSSGRSPEVEMWRTIASSLDDCLRVHQQGGYGTDLTPTKLVGRLMDTLDKSIHRMIGAPPPALQPTPENTVQNNEQGSLSVPPMVPGRQSTVATVSLMPSASVEAISEWTSDNQRNMHNRSVSEPDFGRSPKQEQTNSSSNASSSDMKSKASNSGGSSRLSLFSTGFFQKTMGWVSRSRSDHQAKLGEANKFYYDEKLKRWVEEGSEPPPEEATPPPPPPTMTSFQNRGSDYNINTALKSQNSLPKGETDTVPPAEVQHSSGIPPMPPSQNHFSSRGRMGIHSRYVDTFNKGGGRVASSFQPSASQAVKPIGGAKFFVPTPVAATDTDRDASESIQESSSNEDASSTAPVVDSSSSSLSSPPLKNSVQRFSSVDNISPLRNKSGVGVQNGDASFTSPLRAASWSGGSFADPSNTKIHGSKTSVDTKLGLSPQFIPNGPKNVTGDGRLGDEHHELHEVEL